MSLKPNDIRQLSEELAEMPLDGQTRTEADQLLKDFLSRTDGWSLLGAYLKVLMVVSAVVVPFVFLLCSLNRWVGPHNSPLNLRQTVLMYFVAVVAFLGVAVLLIYLTLFRSAATLGLIVSAALLVGCTMSAVLFETWGSRVSPSWTLVWVAGTCGALVGLYPLPVLLIVEVIDLLVTTRKRMARSRGAAVTAAVRVHLLLKHDIGWRELPGSKRVLQEIEAAAVAVRYCMARPALPAFDQVTSAWLRVARNDAAYAVRCRKQAVLLRDPDTREKLRAFFTALVESVANRRWHSFERVAVPPELAGPTVFDHLLVVLLLGAAMYLSQSSDGLLGGAGPSGANLSAGTSWLSPASLVMWVLLAIAARIDPSAPGRLSSFRIFGR